VLLAPEADVACTATVKLPGLRKVANTELPLAWPGLSVVPL
jgi:hypothetical protein